MAKKLKEPKTFNHPRMYWQDAKDEYSPRVRILYPDGTAEYSHVSEMDCWENDEVYTPCWARDIAVRHYDINGDSCKNYIENTTNVTAEEQLKLMRAYDKKLRFKRAIFMGEIK